MADNVTLHPTAFASKSISSVEWHYSNIKCKTLEILHGLEKFYHYCFAREVHVITGHRPLFAILSKDEAMLSSSHSACC